MGLAGRKVKQRIPADPRNLAWADDAAKFGTNYLSKFGWDSSKGLGVDGGGRTSHIKVSHKLDMLGIGAAHQMDPNGIAWKQNKDFENLLKRLNEAAVPENTPTLDAGGELPEEVQDKGENDSEKEKTRKRKKGREGASEEKAKKKRKEDAGDGASEDVSGEKSGQEAAKVEDALAKPPKTFVPRNRAHRARAIASKSILSKPEASIAEILGIAPTPCLSTSGSGVFSDSGTPLGKLTSLDDASVTLEKLTTSTKSVADYFKEKLLAKTSKSGTATPPTPCFNGKSEYPYDAPRSGLGSSRLQLDTNQESLDWKTERIGLNKFSSLMSSTFLSATTSLSPPSDLTPDDLPEEVTLPVIRKAKRKEKKKTSEEDGGPVIADQEPERKRKEKKEKEGKKKDVRQKQDTHAVTGDNVENALLKEERRRLRKEKKSRKEADAEDHSS